MLHMLNKTNQVGCVNAHAKAKPSLAFLQHGIFRMLLQRVWQTAYNRIFIFRKVIVSSNFRVYNRNSIEKFTVEEVLLYISSGCHANN